MEKLQYSVTPDASDRWRDSELGPEMQEAIKNLLRAVKRDGGGVAHTVTVYGNVYRLVDVPRELYVPVMRGGKLSEYHYHTPEEAHAKVKRNPDYYTHYEKFVPAPKWPS